MRNKEVKFKLKTNNFLILYSLFLIPLNNNGKNCP